MKKSMKILSIGVLVMFTVAVSTGPVLALSGVTVTQVVGASAVVAGGAVVVPALVKGLAASKWVPLAVSAAQLAPVVASIIIGGLAVAGIQAAAKWYFSSTNGATMIQGGQVGYDNMNHGYPSGFTPAASNNNLGMFASQQAAWDAVNNISHNNGMGATSIGQGYWSQNYAGSPYVYTTTYAYYGNTVLGPDTSTFVPYTPTTLSTDISAGVSAGEPSALALTKAALTELNSNIKGLSDSIAASTVAAARAVLNNAVTQTQKDVIDALEPQTDEEIAEATGTDAQIQANIQAAVTAALEAQGLSGEVLAEAIGAVLEDLPAGATPEEIQAAVEAALQSPETAEAMKAAVKAALDDETGVVEPTDTQTVLPEKLSLTAVMGSFMTSINALPGLSTLRGLHVTCGGSSTLCMTFLGQQGCYDVAQVPGLDGIGETLFGLISLVSFIGIFRG